jgi:hypothetical protein
MRNIYNILLGTLKGAGHLGELNVGGQNWLDLERLDVTMWTGVIWLIIGSVMGVCEHGHEK